jgi:hypothetical protein
MRTLVLHSEDEHVLLYRVGIVLFVAVLVLHGTHLRLRSEAGAPTVDWVVLGRVIVCAAAAVIGLMMIRRTGPVGWGGTMLLGYGLATALSGLRCPYRATVLGYSILLLGASLLTIVLVYAARNLDQLRRIERTWFVTVAVLVIKDTVTSHLTEPARPTHDVPRLGAGVTNPVELSLLAALLFWLSFGAERRCPKAVMWGFRAVLMYILIAAKTRTSIFAFLVGGLLYVVLAAPDRLKRIVTVGAVSGTLLSFCLLSVYSNQSWAGDTVDYLKRGQDSEGLASMTGRTQIWNHVLPKISETPILGHGYGVSRLTMGKPRDAGFQPFNCHNTMLEVLFSTGLVGLIPFTVMLLYSLRWIVRYTRLAKVFSRALALHAACAVGALLAGSLSEARLCVRLTPFQPLFFFYLATLDRERHFLRLAAQQPESKT